MASMKSEQSPLLQVLPFRLHSFPIRLHAKFEEVFVTTEIQVRIYTVVLYQLNKIVVVYSIFY